MLDYLECIVGLSHFAFLNFAKFANITVYFWLCKYSCILIRKFHRTLLLNYGIYLVACYVDFDHCPTAFPVVFTSCTMVVYNWINVPGTVQCGTVDMVL